MTLTTEDTPELVTIRWGFTSLADLVDRVPERLHPFAETAIMSSSFRLQVDRTSVTGRQERTPRGMNQTEIAARLTQECARLDAAAVKETERRARFEQTHLCAVTGAVDGTTEHRIPPWGGDRINCSARGHAILTRVWVETATTTELAAARALLPTAEPAQPPTRSRRIRTESGGSGDSFLPDPPTTED